MARIIWILVAALVAIWLLGFLLDIAGNLIHFVLVLALIVLAFQFISGRRSV